MYCALRTRVLAASQGHHVVPGEQMSQLPVVIPPIPGETARSARAIFGSSNFYLLVGDRLEVLLQELRLELLITVNESPQSRIPVFALVTFFQRLEELSDRQAVDALRSRLDWKYALHLAPVTQSFNPDGLCCFRRMVLRERRSRREFEHLATRLRRLAHVREGDLHPLSTTALILEICGHNRLQELYRATRAVIEVLARLRPLWLGQIALPHWYIFYHDRKSSSVDTTHSKEVAADAIYLLQTIEQYAPPEVTGLREVEALEHVCREHLSWSRPEDVQFLPTCWLCRAFSEPGSAKEGQALGNQTKESDGGRSESQRTAET